MLPAGGLDLLEVQGQISRQVAQHGAIWAIATRSAPGARRLRRTKASCSVDVGMSQLHRIPA